MKRFLRKLGHGVSDAPCIQTAEVCTALWHKIGKGCKLQGRGIERRMIEEILHSVGHGFLDGVGLAQLLQILTP